MVDAVFAGERFDLGVLLQILRRDILNVVIDGEHGLRRIGDRGRADLLELWHHLARANRNKISGRHDRARSQSISVACRNLFNEREAHTNYLTSSSSP